MGKIAHVIESARGSSGRYILLPVSNKRTKFVNPIRRDIVFWRFPHEVFENPNKMFRADIESTGDFFYLDIVRIFCMNHVQCFSDI